MVGERVATQSASPDLVRFKEYELDLRTGELRRDGDIVKLRPQPSKVLILLVSRAGQIVTRQEIANEVWGSETFVDFEQGLNFAIRQIRTALGDDADHPRFLETLPKRGYRFAAPISNAEVPPSLAAVKTLPPSDAPKTSSPTAIVLVATVLLITAVALLVWRGYSRKSQASVSANPHIEALAVLPLHNLSADPKQDYFSEGMTDELITDLAKFSKLRVISHTSVERYKETKMTVPEIARELGVDAIVEGSVTRSGDHVRITAQLIDAHTDQHLWAESYERNFRDVLSLQSEVAQQIASNIGVNLTQGEQVQLAGNRKVDPAAYEAYLKGNFYWDRLDCDGYSTALGYFQQAIAKDPKFAPAYVGVADSYFNLAEWQCIPQDEALAKSKEADLKALEIDPNSGEAHVQLGEIAFYHEWDWAKAEKELKQGIALDPNQGHGVYAIFLVATGKQEQGLAEIRKLHETDPVSEVSNLMSTYVFYLTHHFDDAIDQAKKTLDLYPRSASMFFWLGASYEMKGMKDEAFQTYLEGGIRNGTKKETLDTYRKAYQEAGMEGYWREEYKFAQLNKVNKVCLEMLNARHFSDKERTLQLLNTAFEQHCDQLQFLAVDPIYDNLRGDPRFKDLLARMKLQ